MCSLHSLLHHHLLPDSRRDRAEEKIISARECVTHMVINPTATTTTKKKKKKIRVSRQTPAGDDCFAWVGFLASLGQLSSSLFFPLYKYIIFPSSQAFPSSKITLLFSYRPLDDVLAPKTNGVVPKQFFYLIQNFNI